MSDDKLESEFEIYLKRDDGRRIASLSSAGVISYTNTVNAPGNFLLTLTGNLRHYIALDRIVEIWRKPPGGLLKRDFSGFVWDYNFSKDDSGAETVVISGPDLKGLLEQRKALNPVRVAAEVMTTDFLDDMMKTIVTNHYLTSWAHGVGERAIPAIYFRVQSDYSKAPSSSQSFSGEGVLDILQRLAETSRQQGTDLYFDIEPVTDSLYEFRTYTGQRGRDRTTNGPIFGTAYGNIRNPSYDVDATNEINFGWCAGPEAGISSPKQVAEDVARSLRSIWSRREGVASTPADPTAANMLGAARALVIGGRPLAVFTGEVIDVEGSRYGVDWSFGDKLSISEFGLNFPAMVRAVTVNVAEGKKTITAGVEAYFTIDPIVLRGTSPDPTYKYQPTDGDHSPVDR